MSLVKKPEMTEKKLAANARNRKHAHGPATVEGRERTLRTRCGNRSHSPQRRAHAENAELRLSRGPAGHQPAAEA